MLNKRVVGTITEMLLIVAIAAAAGVFWNRTLLASAWGGKVTPQARASQSQSQAQSPASPAGEELLPMPIAMAQVKELHDAGQAIIVDARSTDQFAQGHIAGAIALPLETLRKNPAAALNGKAAKDATIIAYCNGFSCHDSMEVGKMLMKAGYASVYVYEGGYPEWKDAGYPVAKGGI